MDQGHSVANMIDIILKERKIKLLNKISHKIQRISIYRLWPLYYIHQLVNQLPYVCMIERLTISAMITHELNDNCGCVKANGNQYV